MLTPFSRFSPQWRLLLLVVVASLGLFALLIAAGESNVSASAEQPDTAQVGVIAVELSESYQQPRLFIGRVEASQRTELAFDRSGKLAQIVAIEGQPVAQGQLIAQLDGERLHAELAEVQASLQKAKAQARLARVARDRIAALVKRNLDSSQNLDEAEANLAVADANVGQIEAGIERLNVEVRKLSLFAPYAANVTHQYADVGNVVNAGQAVVQLQASGAAEVRLAVPAALNQEFSIGQRYSLNVEGRTVSGTVRDVVAQRSQSTRTVDVIFTLDDTQNVLAGDLVTLASSSTHDETGVWLPVTALSSGLRGLWSVMVVSELGQQQAEARLVEVLYADQQKAYVRGGLKPGDYVVASGHHKLVPGQQVNARVLSDSESSLAMRSAN